MRRKLIIDGNAVYEIDDECKIQREGQSKFEEKTEALFREKGREKHSLSIDTSGRGKRVIDRKNLEYSLEKKNNE